MRDAYWDWAKNQIYEKTNTLGDVLAAGPCTLEPNLVEETIVAYSNEDPDSYLLPNTFPDRPRSLGAAPVVCRWNL